MARGALAYIRAALRRSSAGMPLSSSTRSGVYSATTCRSASKPSVRSATYRSSHRPSSRITFIRPLSQAASVPGRGRSQMCANLTSSTLRGSMMMSLARWRSTARLTIRPMMGWFSAVFEPVMRMQSVFSISDMEFVIAPLPKLAARPATVTECHNRAQWSTLFVPSTPRNIFWKT